MKVVINRCYGAFSLSTVALELIRSRVPNASKDDAQLLSDLSRNPEGYCSTVWLRAHPEVVNAVEVYGPLASDDCAKLEIVEVAPDEEWHISEYDGNEEIVLGPSDDRGSVSDTWNPAFAAARGLTR